MWRVGLEGVWTASRGRPHMSSLGSSLCGRPMEWPSSWAITLRRTFGSVSRDGVTSYSMLKYRSLAAACRERDEVGVGQDHQQVSREPIDARG